MRTVYYRCYGIRIRENSVVGANSVKFCKKIDLLFKTKTHLGKIMIFF